MPVVTLNAFDHLGLKSADVERTLEWYLDRLGTAPVRVDEWHRGEAPVPSVRVAAETIIDLVAGPSDDGRLDHICLVGFRCRRVRVAARRRRRPSSGACPRAVGSGSGGRQL